MNICNLLHYNLINISFWAICDLNVLLKWSKRPFVSFIRSELGWTCLINPTERNGLRGLFSLENFSARYWYWLLSKILVIKESCNLIEHDCILALKLKVWVSNSREIISVFFKVVVKPMKPSVINVLILTILLFFQKITEIDKKNSEGIRLQS